LVGPLPEGWLVSDAADKARKSIKRLIEHHYVDKGLWAVKDPRMCRLMPLWQPVLDEMGFTPGFIFTVRYPFEVAGSLAKRDNFSFQKGLLLWLVHNLDCLSVVQGRPYIVNLYDQLLTDPVSTLEKIEKGLGINFPKSVQQLSSEILEFVQPELKNQHLGHVANKELSRFEHYAEVYNQLRMIGTENDLPTTLPFSNLSHLDNITSTDTKIFNDLLLYTGDQERARLKCETQKEQKLSVKTTPEKTLMAQVFFPQDSDPAYTEENSKTFVLTPDQWQEITCDIPAPALISTKGLRLDPLNTNGVINISSIKFINKATEEALFQLDKHGDLQNCKITGHAFVLPDRESFTLFSYNFDPQLILPLLPNMPDCPLELRVWVKVSTNQEIIRDTLEKMQ
jgi:hypothetical protein